MNTPITLTVGDLTAVIIIAMLLAGLAVGLLTNWINERRNAERQAEQRRRHSIMAGELGEAQAAVEGRALR